MAIVGKVSVGAFISLMNQILSLGSRISWFLSGIIYRIANSIAYMNDFKDFF